MSQYFPKLYEAFGGDIIIRVDLSDYATKADLETGTEVDISKLGEKPDLVSLAAEVDKLDIEKLENFPVDLSKLSDLVKNDVAKKQLSMIN